MRRARTVRCGRACNDAHRGGAHAAGAGRGGALEAVEQHVRRLSTMPRAEIRLRAPLACGARGDITQSPRRTAAAANRASLYIHTVGRGGVMCARGTRASHA
eukprot:4855194-Prymnesium_polylepis.1